MAWLTREAEVLAAVDRDGSGWRRRPLKGARLVAGPRLVHTFGAQHPVDVAWCRCAGEGGQQLEVRRLAALRPRRVARPCGPRLAVVVAPFGAFERWRLQVGDRLEVTGE